MASPSETQCNNGDCSTQNYGHTQTITVAPNPFSVIFKTQYNFLLCGHLHLAHTFNVTALAMYVWIVTHCLKLEHTKKPPVLKPCFRNVRLNPANDIVNGDQKDHSARIPQIWWCWKYHFFKKWVADFSYLNPCKILRASVLEVWIRQETTNFEALHLLSDKKLLLTLVINNYSYSYLVTS